MGPMGVYRLFATGGIAVGGMMKRPPTGSAAVLGLLFRRRRRSTPRPNASRQAGGSKLMGPQEVPGGAWIAQFFDPQGALFALVAAKR